MACMYVPSAQGIIVGEGEKRKVKKLESGKGVREERAKEKESYDTEWFHNRKQLSVVVHALCIMHGCNNCCGCIWFCITAGKVRGWKAKKGGRGLEGSVRWASSNSKQKRNS